MDRGLVAWNWFSCSIGWYSLINLIVIVVIINIIIVIIIFFYIIIIIVVVVVVVDEPRLAYFSLTKFWNELLLNGSV